MSGAKDKRRRTRINSKITQLPEDIKDQLDAMLLDTSNTYEDAVAWLDEQGYHISRSSVGRYAIRSNQATQRVIETIEKSKAIAQAVEKHPDLDDTKPNRMLMMEGLMRRVSTAEDDFLEMPLDKAGRLIASLSRTQIYEDKIKHDYKTKTELALEGLEADLMRAIKGDADLAKELKALILKAKEKMIADD